MDLAASITPGSTSFKEDSTIVTGTILGYSAMAGTVGGGGLGDIAVRYGYNRWQTDIMLVTVILLVVLVLRLCRHLRYHQGWILFQDKFQMARSGFRLHLQGGFLFPR